MIFGSHKTGWKYFRRRHARVYNILHALVSELKMHTSSEFDFFDLSTIFRVRESRKLFRNTRF